ncbi:MAG: MFS transporter [Lachnospiraceae bacterium]|nr:MFS transporter [Lachnospiraceae bacterium]
METKGKNKVVIAAGLLIMSLTMACNSALSPILAEVGKTFANASDASIQIVLTLINLITLPMMLLEPLLERVMTKRNVAILGTFFMLVGGLLPQILNTSLWHLYLASIVIGTGLSLVVVTSSSLISDYFTGIDKSRVMGFQSIFVSIGGTIIAKGSGTFTATWGWQRGYLVFLIAVPIIIAIFCMVPKGEIQKAADSGEKSGIDGSMVYFGILCLITGIFVATFNTNIAMYLDRKGIGDAGTAGTVASIMQVVGILGGLLLGNVVKLFKRFTIGAAIIMMAAGCALVGLSTSLPLICVGAFLMGIGFAIRNPGAVTFAANMVSAKQASMAIAIVSATYNVGNFLSAYIVNPVANMISEDISSRFILSAVALLVIGLIACVKAPTTDQQALDSQS